MREPLVHHSHVKQTSHSSKYISQRFLLWFLIFRIHPHSITAPNCSIGHQYIFFAKKKDNPKLIMKSKLTALFLLVLTPFCFAETAIGSVILDEVTYSKIIPKHEIVLVKFDQMYPWGDHLKEYKKLVQRWGLLLLTYDLTEERLIFISWRL